MLMCLMIKVDINVPNASKLKSLLSGILVTLLEEKALSSNLLHPSDKFLN